MKPAPAPIVVNVIAAPLSSSKTDAVPFAAFAGQNLTTAATNATPSPSVFLKDKHSVLPPAPLVLSKPVEAPWVITPGDVTLRRALAKWAARAGWQLVWEASVDVPIAVNASFSGDFRGAVKQLFQSLSAADVNLTGLMYSGNRVIRVTESGRRAQ